MDLRRPPRDWRKNPPSLTAAIALISLVLLFGGMCASRSADVNATPMGAAIDFTRRVRDSTDAIPDILFGAGTVVAALFIVIYIFGMGSNDPRSRRYKGD